MTTRKMVHVFFGEKLDLGPDLPPEVAERWLNEGVLGERGRAFRRQPVDRILGVLEEAGRRLTEEGGPYRAAILERMPAVTGYSPRMVEECLGLLGAMLTADALERRLACLGDYRCLDGFVCGRKGTLLRALPLGSVCHVAAGNIFLASVDSLVSGVITKNVNVLKCSGQDTVFPALFFGALEEADREGVVFPHVALTYWRHGNAAVSALVKRVFDAILLFGGEESVREYKQGLAPKTRLLDFGPKASFGVVCRGLSDAELREAAAGFALDLTLWEQRACTSCQNVFVEGDGERFAGYLFEALEALATRYPQGGLDLDEAVEVRKERELAFWEDFNGNGRLWEGKGSARTVILRRGRDLVPPPLNRTVFVIEVQECQDLLEGNLKAMGYYMSTAGIAAPKERVRAVAEELMDLGVMRLCRPGTMGLGGQEESPHDGVHLALQLVRLVTKEDLPSEVLGLDCLPAAEREDLVLARLNALLRKALRSPFYRERYRGIMLPLPSLEAFSDLPPLEKADLTAHTYPKTDMLTGEARDFYLFSSGGTTGAMRYVCYTPEEFERSARVWGRGFRALGLGGGDAVANVLQAGALYTGFLATNRGLEETGCRILSLTSNQPPEETLHYLREFRPTAIMGMVTGLLQLAQAAEDKGVGLRIEKVFYAGEHLPPTGRSLLQRAFAPQVIGSFGYAAVEVGPIAFQCSHCAGTEHHLHRDHCHLELTREGEVLVTTLGRTLHPLIRYRLGDQAEWVEGPCPCGRTGPRLRLLGRTHDYVRVHAGEIYVSEVAEAISTLPELSGAFQIVVEGRGARVDVTIVVETLHDDGSCRDEELARRAREAVLHGIAFLRSTAKRDLSGELGLELEVRLEPPGTIPRLPRTGKIAHIADRRAP